MRVAAESSTIFRSSACCAIHRRCTRICSSGRPATAAGAGHPRDVHLTIQLMTTVTAAATREKKLMSPASYESPWMNDDVGTFRKAVRQFIHKEFVPHQARWCAQHHPDKHAWLAAGAIDMLLPDVPEEYGGGGGTFAHEAVVLEEL